MSAPPPVRGGAFLLKKCKNRVLPSLLRQKATIFAKDFLTLNLYDDEKQKTEHLLCLVGISVFNDVM